LSDFISTTFLYNNYLKPEFFTSLKELKTVFAPKGLLLSAAVTAVKSLTDTAYDIPTIAE
jgi:hypothetical protein